MTGKRGGGGEEGRGLGGEEVTGRRGDSGKLCVNSRWAAPKGAPADPGGLIR